MTMSYQQKRRGLIAKIKVAQQQLDIDDGFYREILKKETNKTSCGDMDILELQKVLRAFEQLGFIPTRNHLGNKPLHVVKQTAMINKLTALLSTANKSWAYADSMAKRMFQKEKVQYLSDEQLHKLIAALNYHVLKEKSAQMANLK